MTRLTHLSVTDLLREFSAPSPTPGGGSASALGGAVGAALLAMVAGMPRTRTGADAEREALAPCVDRLLDTRDHLAALIEQDAAAYDAVVVAYRLPKATDEEQAARRGAVESALRGAIEVPLEVMRSCHAAAREGLVVAANGNPNASSDVSVAFELLSAGLAGAAMNARINLGSVREAGYVDGVRGEVDRLTSSMQQAVTSARAALPQRA